MQKKRRINQNVRVDQDFFGEFLKTQFLIGIFSY